MKTNNLLTLSIFCIVIILPSFAWTADDPETAAIRSACEKGNSFGCFRMGERLRILDRDNKNAIKFYIKACDADYMTGCTNGGILLFQQGTHGSSQWKNAKKMFQKACDAGEDTSCFNMGKALYKEGRQKKAIKFYHKACKMGNPAGCALEKKLSQ